MFSLGLPNLITLTRIFTIPAISYCYLKGFYSWALGLLFYAGFSDVIDGYLARRMSHRTKLGAILDPAADKLLMTVMFVTLTASHQIPWWLTLMVITRDIYIVTGVFLLRWVVKKVYIRPTPISKLTTFFQLALLFFCLSRSFLENGPPFLAQNFLSIVLTLLPLSLYLVAIITVASGVHYTLVGLAIYRNRENDLFFQKETETGGERFSSGGGSNPP